MIDPTVRPARPGDATQLRDLEGEARGALADQRGGGRWLATHATRGDGWTTVVGAERAIVATIDDVVVGYVVVGLPGEDGVATIDEVYVTPGARELGFGDALLEAALVRVRAAGARWLEGEALPGDRDTKNLYERAGIKARLITVSTEL